MTEEWQWVSVSLEVHTQIQGAVCLGNIWITSAYIQTHTHTKLRAPPNYWFRMSCVSNAMNVKVTQSKSYFLSWALCFQLCTHTDIFYLPCIHFNTTAFQSMVCSDVKEIQNKAPALFLQLFFFFWFKSRIYVCFSCKSTIKAPW